ncbi:MAG: phosphatase [Coriobacteriales bacterium]|jgi:exopolyphosphatase/guanosine-5'-triphosphate,3'-diphosphate pyrophosphatase
MRRAVIDIGTVTTRLLVAECDGRRAERLLKESIITNLGKGLVGSGALTDEAIARVLSAIDEHIESMAELGIDLGTPEGRSSVAAIATSAARDASNGDVLVQALCDRGIRLEVISGEREAFLSFSGATVDFPGKGLLVFDIGGGSTELVLGERPPEGAPTILRRISFDVGCRRALELFRLDDPSTPEQRAAIVDWARDELSSFFEGIEGEVQRAIGVAGTPTSLVSIAEGLAPYDPDRVHGYMMEVSRARSLADRLFAMTLEERRHVVGLQPERADVMVPGALILQAVLELAGLDRFTVSESDNMLGLLLDWPE